MSWMTHQLVFEQVLLHGGDGLDFLDEAGAVGLGVLARDTGAVLEDSDGADTVSAEARHFLEV
jgi:hypothetical protein